VNGEEEIVVSEKLIEDRLDSEWPVPSPTIDERVEDQKLGIGVAPSLAITELARGESSKIRALVSSAADDGR